MRKSEVALAVGALIGAIKPPKPGYSHPNQKGQYFPLFGCRNQRDYYDSSYQGNGITIGSWFDVNEVIKL